MPQSAPLCLSCSSTIVTRSKSKPDQKDPYITSCCDLPICANCLQRNPRLKEWNPCLWCASGVNTIGSGSRTKSSKQMEAERESRKGDERFEIGDDSDLDEEEMDNPPPPYVSENLKEPERSEHPGNGQGDIHAPQPTDLDQAQIPAELEEVQSYEPREHLVQKGDTIRSLALKYRIDPYDLLNLNKIPYSALHTNPNLLQTRKTILLSQPKPSKDEPIGGPNENEQRAAERRVKRFQILTKTPDPGIAKAYLAIQNLDDSISTSTPGSVLFESDPFDPESYESQSTTGEEKSGDSEKEKPKPGQVTVEGRAVDRYYSDEEWAARIAQESSSSSKGKSKSGLRGLLGSKDKGKTAVRKGDYIQGAPWIESR